MEVEVRQLGTSSMSEVPAAILKQGSTYLLFLTPSMLSGDLAHQYHVTGGDAGIYIGPSQALSTGKVPTTRFTQAVAVRARRFRRSSRDLGNLADKRPGNSSCSACFTA